MLTGNDNKNFSIAPVAVLWPGYSKFVDETWVDSNCYPYHFQTALDRAGYDHQLLTYDRFENSASVNPATKQIDLYTSRYKVLILPPVQHIPHATLAKAKQFVDDGSVVIGWQRAPSKSAKFGHFDKKVQDLSVALWGSLTPSASVVPLKKNANRGRLPVNRSCGTRQRWPSHHWNPLGFQPTKSRLNWDYRRRRVA